MASVLDTTMQLYAAYSASLDINYRTRTTAGAAMAALDAAKNPSNRIFSPGELAAGRKNFGSPAQKLSYINSDGVTIGTSRETSPMATSFGSTGFAVVVYTVHEAKISVIDDNFRGNTITKEQYLATKMHDMEMGILNAIDSEVVTGLSAQKSIFTNAKTPFTFSAGQFLVDSAAASVREADRFEDWSVFFAYLDSIKTADSHENAEFWNMIGSPNSLAMIKWAQKYGAMNQFDAQVLWNGIYPYISKNIAEGAGTPVSRANAYFVLPKSMQLETWISGDAIEGLTNGQVTVGQMYSPVLDRNVEIYEQTGLIDYSAVNATSKRVWGTTLAITVETAQVYTLDNTNAAQAGRIYNAAFRVGV